IRLLDLHPGGPDDDLQCTLRIVDLHSQPKYEALSYVWGDFNVLAPLTVNDTIVNVTKNLNTALRRLRFPSDVRCLWADALCINQKDVAEKQQQIGLMRDIYASATGVTMWLG
ncbi:heterokaryon incompatibility protein-domain-containing protein, partial [Phaeosphaeriaceae sp. PMI808]